MKKTTAGVPVAIVLCALVLTACNRQETAVQGEVTETIAPASPQPGLTGTDALTQTVDIEGGRTDAEGAGITGTVPTDSTGTAADTATAGSPPPATGTRYG